MSDIPPRTIIFHMERGHFRNRLGLLYTQAISIVMAIPCVGDPVVLFRSVSLVKNIHPCMPNPLGGDHRFFRTSSLVEFEMHNPNFKADFCNPNFKQGVIP